MRYLEKLSYLRGFTQFLFPLCSEANMIRSNFEQFSMKNTMTIFGITHDKYYGGY